MFHPRHPHKVHAKFSRHLSEAVILEDGLVRQNYRLMLMAAILACGLFLFIAGSRQINEAVKTTGQFTPRSSVRAIQASEGGIVAKLFIQEGDLVEKGGVLLRLVNTNTLTEREQVQARLSGLLAKSARLNGYLNESLPDFSFIDIVKYSDLYKDQLSLLRAQNQVRQSSLWVIQTQISQKKAEVAVYEEQLHNARLREGVNSKLLALRDGLASKNLVSRITQLSSKRDYLTSEGEIQRLAKQLDKSRESLQEVEHRHAALAADFRREARNELGMVENEIAQVKQTLAKIEDRTRQMDILAPVKGRIQDLRTRTPGSVVMSGDPLLEIVPEGDELNLEVRIPPKDIGFVKTGQEVIIKINSYDYAIFGTVSGRLVSISPFTYMDVDKKVYYKGIVYPDAKTMGRNNSFYPILPGMDAHADIITGQRLLLSYLLKPLLAITDPAYRQGAS